MQDICLNVIDASQAHQTFAFVLQGTTNLAIQVTIGNGLLIVVARIDLCHLRSTIVNGTIMLHE